MLAFVPTGRQIAGRSPLSFRLRQFRCAFVFLPKAQPLLLLCDPFSQGVVFLGFQLKVWDISPSNLFTLSLNLNVPLDMYALQNLHLALSLLAAAFCSMLTELRATEGPEMSFHSHFEGPSLWPTLSVNLAPRSQSP